MKFFEVPNSTYFVLINPYEPSFLCVKDTEGKARRCLDWSYITISDNAEVQVVLLK